MAIRQVRSESMKISPARLRWRNPGFTRRPLRIQISLVCEIAQPGLSRMNASWRSSLVGDHRSSESRNAISGARAMATPRFRAAAGPRCQESSRTGALDGVGAIESEDSAAQLVDSLAGSCRTENRAHAHRVETFERGGALRTAQLVTLGRDRNHFDTAIRGHRRQIEFVVLRTAAAIDENRDGGEIDALVDVFMHHGSDFGRFPVTHFRVAEARQVAQRERVADCEEVETARAPGSLAGAREALDSGERIEQRTLAHVGAARERNL